MESVEKSRLNEIKLLVLDVDGVLTEGQLIYNGDGSESKIFNVHDGHGIKLWLRAGLKVAFLSGRQSEPTRHRAAHLGVDFCFQNCIDKLPVLEKLAKDLNLSRSEIAYMGDDLPDLPPMRYAGLSMTVPNAVFEVRQAAHYVTTLKGGCGAVREAIEYILKGSGRWAVLMKRYLQ
jgi:3-deoxy-D-manno-octulosonate 8-phosphate phosphatase (KDO 8-P phosphatase)